MMLNAQVVQFGSCPRKHQKTPQTHFGWLKLYEIAEELKISESSVFTILHEHLSMRNLFSKWTLRLLTVNQKQQHIDNSEHFLQLFQCNKKEFLLKYVTI